jgi:PAS domain S-box-containing protein
VEDYAGTVLVVDDEDSIRRVISQTLQRSGYECVQAGSAQEALEKTATQEFDIVLLDIKMPGMSGIEVLPELTFEHPDICVVMSTAVNDTQTAVEAMNLGAYDYIVKPFDLDALIMKVERALERKTLLLENRDFRLQQAERQFDALIENLADAVVRLRLGMVDWCNDRVEDVLGYTKDELTGVEVQQLFPEDIDGAEALASIEEGIRGHGRLHGTTRLRKKDGNEVHIGYSASQIAGKEPLEIVAVLRDITEIHQVQEEQERLMQAYKEQTQVLSKAYQELEEALADVKTLRGLLPMCARCNKIRDDGGYWKEVETYISANSEADFSHGLCPDCARKLEGAHLPEGD